MTSDGKSNDQCRRELLTIVGTVISAGLAGCTGTLDESNSNADISYPPKSVSNGLWVSTDKSTQKLNFPGLSGHAGIRIYQNTSVQEDIQRRFAGQFARPLALGFASRIEYSGVTSTGVTSGRIYDEVRPAFMNRLTEEGLSNISELAKDTWENDNRPDPPQKLSKGEKFGEFTADYAVAEQTSKLNLSEYGEQAFEFPTQTLSMRAVLFVTDLTLAGTTGTAYVVGGAYPDENYENQASSTLAQNNGSSLSATVILDSGLNIGKLRQSLVNQFIVPVLDEVADEH